MRSDEGLEPPARTERTLLMLFFILRAVYLTLAVVTTTLGWHAYRRPWLVAGLVVAAYAETAVVVHQLRRGKAYDRVLVVLAEVLFGIAGLTVIATALKTEDLTTYINWMLPYTCGTAAGVAIGMRSYRGGVLLTGLMALTYGLTVRKNFSLSGSQAATAAANLANYAAFYLVASWVARGLRHAALETVTAQNGALRDARLLAAADERNLLHRQIHDSALQTLEAIARDPASPGHIRNDARREAARVRSILRDEMPGACVGLLAALNALVEDFAGEGLNVELVATEVHSSPSAHVTDALEAAAREALRNVVKHAGVQRVVVRAAATRGSVELSVRDHGGGFVPCKATEGFGITESIRSRMTEVAGRAEIRSTPGEGTLVTLSVGQ